MSIRLGELLVQSGAITPEQLEHLLRVQRTRPEPLGVLAEEIFEVDPRLLEDAWARQFVTLTAKIDPRREPVDRGVVGTVSARQAWQFHVLPMRYDGHEVMVCTSQSHLPRALRFSYSHYGPACWLVIAEPDALYEAMQRYYPMGISRDEWMAMSA